MQRGKGRRSKTVEEGGDGFDPEMNGGRGEGGGGGRSAKKRQKLRKKEFFDGADLSKMRDFFGSCYISIFFPFLFPSFPFVGGLEKYWRDPLLFYFPFFCGDGGETVTKGQKLPTPKNKKMNIPTYFGYATKFGWDRGKEKREIMMVSEFPF